jgi:hypothetical protein
MEVGSSPALSRRQCSPGVALSYLSDDDLSHCQTSPFVTVAAHEIL